jgi:hypothetical protein
LSSETISEHPGFVGFCLYETPEAISATPWMSSVCPQSSPEAISANSNRFCSTCLIPSSFSFHVLPLHLGFRSAPASNKTFRDPAAFVQERLPGESQLSCLHFKTQFSLPEFEKLLPSVERLRQKLSEPIFADLDPPN